MMVFIYVPWFDEPLLCPLSEAVLLPRSYRTLQPNEVLFHHSGKKTLNILHQVSATAFNYYLESITCFAASGSAPLLIKTSTTFSLPLTLEAI